MSMAQIILNVVNRLYDTVIQDLLFTYLRAANVINGVNELLTIQILSLKLSVWSSIASHI